MTSPRLAALPGVLAVALLPALHLLLLKPMLLHGGNAAEFASPLGALLVLYLRPALAWLAFAALLALLGGRRAVPVLLRAFAALTLLLWLQGSLLVWDYGRLDGRPIDWSVHAGRGWFELALWLAVLALALRGPARHTRAWVVGAVVVTVAAVPPAWLARGSAPAAGAPSFTTGSVALGYLPRFSTGRNVLLIVADGLQGDVFAELLADPRHGPRLSRAFAGFTVFDRHLGAYPYTHLSVPALLSGRLYRNEEPRPAFLDAALGPGAPSLLNAAAAAGFAIDIAVATGLEPLYARGAADHVVSLGSDFAAEPRVTLVREAAILFDLALFRSVPHLLKARVHAEQRWLAQRLFADPRSHGLRSFAHGAFLEYLAANLRADRAESVFKVLHVMTSHDPMATDAECRYAGGVLPTMRQTVLWQARCGLLAIAAVLERLAERGLYEDATIAVLGDHGAWVAPRGLAPIVKPGGRHVYMDPTIVAMATPVLAVKPPGARGALRHSAAPSALTDVPATVAGAAGIVAELPGVDAMTLADDATRERRFHLYRYRSSEWRDDYLPTIHEYVVRGAPLDSAAWHQGKPFRPPP